MVWSERASCEKGEVFMRRIILLFLGLSAAVWAANGDMGVGTEPLTDGSAAYPWLIEDLADFDAFADPNNSATYWADGVHTKLMTDIDLSGRTYTAAVVAPDINIIDGFQGTRFTGVFDGNGRTVFNLTVSAADQDYIGLFGYTINATLQNIRLENISISSTGEYIGGLVGYNAFGTTLGVINNCFATGTVSGANSVGGLVGKNWFGSLSTCSMIGSVSGIGSAAGGLIGYNAGTISECFATGSINGNRNVGGLIGRNETGTLTSCYANGSVDGRYYAGGLVGENYSSPLSASTLNKCYATSSVSGLGGVGGLVGNNWGTLTSCYASGPVSGTEAVGGLMGINNYGTITTCYATGSITATGENVGGLSGTNTGLLTNCYATGSVSGGASVGGMIGDNFHGSVLTACYARGPVSGTGEYVGGIVGKNNGLITNCYAKGSISGNSFAGGLVGWHNDYYSLTNCFWDTQTSGTADGVGNLNPDPVGVMGKTTDEMMTLSTFTSAGWDFVSVWGVGNGQTYPYLKPFNGISPADMNHSGQVDMEDLAILAENWLEGV